MAAYQLRNDGHGSLYALKEYKSLTNHQRERWQKEMGDRIV